MSEASTQIGGSHDARRIVVVRGTPGRHTGRAAADPLLLAALAAGSTAAEAADAAGVSERTVRRRLADDDFADKVDAARAEVLDTALARISAGAVAAVDTLLALLTPDEPPSVRLGAARTILEYACRLRAEDELAERLGAIEEHLAMTRGRHS